MNRKEMTVRLNKDLYEKIREAAFYLNISKQQIMEEALKLWLTAKKEQYHAKTERI